MSTITFYNSDVRQYTEVSSTNPLPVRNADPGDPAAIPVSSIDLDALIARIDALEARIATLEAG